MLKVLLNMVDHFGGTSDHDPSWLAYLAGHEEAIKTALAAYNETNDEVKSKLLVLAYAENAYACHFLSDRFAAGHMRPPFKKLCEYCGGIIGGLLVNSMHDEDNLHGLHVRNKRGDSWIAYGDKRYYDDVNAQNRKIVAETLQASADEITHVFTKGERVSLDVDKMVVDLDYLINYSQPDNTVSLFAYDSIIDDVLRRTNINKLHVKRNDVGIMETHRGIEGWGCLTTLLELKVGNYHPYDNGNFMLPNIFGSCPIGETRNCSSCGSIRSIDGVGNFDGCCVYNKKIEALGTSLTSVDKLLVCAGGTTDLHQKLNVVCN